jgi:UDP-N-acetylmuramoylalanine--D-glutamate ligase
MNKDWKNKKVLVIGFGRSGQAAAFALAALGAEVSVQDDRREDDFDREALDKLKEMDVKSYFSSMPPESYRADLLILSPAVSPSSPMVKHFEEAGAEISGELEISYRLTEGKFIAITGTNGKTTTTSLVGEIFRKAGKKTHVVGNIGKAVINEAVAAKSDDFLITEVSSFQLETVKEFKPVISAILNITPDHLDRHHSMAEYANAKAKIFANQTGDDYLVINKDNPTCMELSETANARIVPFSLQEKLDFGAYVDEGSIMIAGNDGEVEVCRIDDLQIVGAHNVENVMAASLIAYFAGIDISIISSAVKAFPGVEHRLEYCGTIRGVRYYNDSKGTNVDASITAIKAINKNIILIAGGDAKGQNFDDLAELFAGRVKKLLLMGRDAHLIGESADRKNYSSYEYLKDMKSCVERAAELAVEGDTVLLSPACASWDMYESYEHRGRDFKQCVTELL